MYNKENLAKLKKMDGLAPEVMKAFWAFDKAAIANGAIPVKDKELTPVAVALTTQCPYCIDIHSGNARKAGATDAEMVEAAMIAAALELERQSHTRRTLCQIKLTPPNRARCSEPGHRAVVAIRAGSLSLDH